jgi:hypothetical protein
MRQGSHDTRPLHITPDRIIGQLGTLVPQIHLTLISVLQGLALAFLLTNLHTPAGFTIPAILQALPANTFYLPQIASLLAIIVTWNEMTFATLILHWPISTIATLLQFLFCISEIAAFSNINHTGSWLFWIGFALLFAFFIRRRNRIVTAPRIRLQTASYQQRTLRPLSAWYVGCFGFLGIGLGWGREINVGTVNQAIMVGTAHIIPFDILASALFVGYFVVALYTDDLLYSRVLSEALKETPYWVKRGFVIDERTHPDAERTATTQ